KDVLHAVDPHQNRIFGVGAVSESGFKVCGHGNPVQMRPLDEWPEIPRRDSLRLETPDSIRSPIIDFLVDGVGCDPLGPSTSRAAEVRPRVVYPRPDLLVAVDALPRLHHSFRVVLARRKRRRHPVCEKDERVVLVFVLPDSSLAQSHVVVRVHVEDAGKHIFVIRQRDHTCTAGILLRHVPIGDEDLSRTNEDSAVVLHRVTRGGENPPATNDHRLRLGADRYWCRRKCDGAESKERTLHERSPLSRSMSPSPSSSTGTSLFTSAVLGTIALPPCDARKPFTPLSPSSV